MSSTFGLVFLLPDFSIIQIVASSTTHPDLIRHDAISADRNAVPRDVSLTLRSPRRRFAPSFTTSHLDGSDDKTTVDERFRIPAARKPVEVGSWNLMFLQGSHTSPVVIAGFFEASTVFANFFRRGIYTDICDFFAEETERWRKLSMAFF